MFIKPVSSAVNTPDVKGDIKFFSVTGSGSFFVSFVGMVVVELSFCVSSALVVTGRAVVATWSAVESWLLFVAVAGFSSTIFPVSGSLVVVGFSDVLVTGKTVVFEGDGNSDFVPRRVSASDAF